MTGKLKPLINYSKFKLSNSYKTIVKVLATTSVKLCLIVLLLVEFSFAQELKVNIEPQQATSTQVVRLSVSVTTNSKSDSSIPKFEESPLFDITFSAQGSSMKMINGDITFSVIYNFSLTPKTNIKPGSYQTPKGLITVNGKQLLIPSKKIEIIKSSPLRNSAQGLKGDSDLVLKQTLSNYTPFVGEQVTYKLMLNTGRNFRNSNVENLQTEGFLVENFDQKNMKKKYATRSSTTIYLNQALFPLYEGKGKIKPRTVNAVVQKKSSFRPRRGLLGLFNDPFHMPSYNETERKIYVAPGIDVDIKPLPIRDKDWKHYIPVGKLEVYSGVSSNEIPLGKSIDFAITVKGDGNLYPLELAELYGIDLDKFTVYHSDPKVVVSNIGEKLIHSKEFVLSLVPKLSGNLEIPQTKFVFFDPKLEEYYEVETPAEKLRVIEESTGDTKVKEKLEPNQNLVDGYLAKNLRSVTTHSSANIEGNFYLNYIIFLTPLIFIFIYLIIDKKKKDVVFRGKLRKEAYKEFNNLLQSSDIDEEVFYKEFKKTISKILTGEELQIDEQDLENLLDAIGASKQDKEISIKNWQYLYSKQYQPNSSLTEVDVEKAKACVDILEKYIR